MPESFSFYSQTSDALPEEQMRKLAQGADFAINTDDGGRHFVYRWPDLTVTVNEMPAKEIPPHLNGFCGYVTHIYGGKPDERGEQVLERIRYTHLVASVVIEPERDEEGRAEHLLGSMAYGLHALMFYGSALYDRDSKLILAPNGSFDPEADVLGPVTEALKKRVMVKLPEQEPYQPTPAQEARYDRELAELKRRQVPTLGYRLYIDDDEAMTLREPAEVARRVLVLSAVTNLADGGKRKTALDLIEQHNLWPAVSPQERK
jgi:hypothetical protein